MFFINDKPEDFFLNLVGEYKVIMSSKPNGNS